MPTQYKAARSREHNRPRPRAGSGSDYTGEVLEVLDGGLEPVDNDGAGQPVSIALRRRMEAKAKRQQALSFLMAGFSYEQIADRMDIPENTVKDLIAKILSRVVNENADEMRALENARLDRAQTAIWTQVLTGDLKAIDMFLRISQRRAKMNGLDEPTQVNLSINVRQEMEQALVALETVVMGEATVIDAYPDPTGR